MPIFWTAEELQELEGTGLVGATAGTKAALEASFEHISTKLVQPNPTVFKAEAFTFERWLWAYCVCVSRSWTVVQEEQADLVLAPLADMLNHDVEASTLQYSEDGGHVLIAATRDYAKGDQLFASYGKKSNYDLLAMYGFVVEDNANDAMQINFQLNPGNLVQSTYQASSASPLALCLSLRALCLSRSCLSLTRSLRLCPQLSIFHTSLLSLSLPMLLSRSLCFSLYIYISLQGCCILSDALLGIVEPLLRVADPNYKRLYIGRNTLPVTLLRLFRLNVMDFSELEFVDRALRGQAVSLANEVKAFRAAIQSLAGMLKAYPTTIEEDAALLARDDISDNVRAAVIVRKGQKEILRNNVLIIGKLWENILVSGKLFGDVAL